MSKIVLFPPVKFAYGAFNNSNCVTLLGFKYRTEKELERKIRRAQSYGWSYDGCMGEFRETETLPAHVKIVF